MTMRQFILLSGILAFASAFSRRHYYKEGSAQSRDLLSVPEPLHLKNRISEAVPAGAIVVTDYGAKGDNQTDNTAAFQAALDAAGQAGDVVFIPSGSYRFQGRLNVPDSVTLQGSFLTVPSHDCRQGYYPTDGSVLMPQGDRGNLSAPAFITLNMDSELHGVVIWHVDQSRFGVPAPYPYAVQLINMNAAVTDVEILNAFNGISAVGAHRHYIARIQGQPLNVGVYIDSTYDIGRIEDVHFNPWYSTDIEFMSWQTTHGRGFVFGRSDWEYVFNTFCFAYAYGYHFVETPTGTMNGNFLGLGADYACNASVQVDASQAPGLLITNGEFTAFHNKQFAPNSTAGLAPWTYPAQIVVGPDNVGPVNLVDTSFWGPSNHVARLQGTGTVTFNSCIFSGWDTNKNQSAAILAEAGRLIVQASEFQQPLKQIELSANVEKAIILGNVVKGDKNIVDHGAKNVQIGYNAFG